MGKQARLDRQRAARELGEMAAIASDLNHALQAPTLVGGFTIKPVIIQAPHLGAIPGAAIEFTTQDGKAHGPFVVEPVAIIHMIARLAAAAAGMTLPEGADPEHESDPHPGDIPVDDDALDVALTPTPGEVTLPSGLVLPG